MNADQVRSLVAGTFPGVLNTPLAVACSTFAAADGADRAVQFASLQARVHARTVASEARQMRADALAHAEDCMDACDGWTVETLGHNIESSFGYSLDADECDDIARRALGL